MLHSLITAFSTYSRIPMPKIPWNPKNMRFVLCFFPLVGVVTGILWYLLLFAFRILPFGNAFTAAVLVLLPLLITGGIHLDGFLDTSDAFHSWRGRDEKLAIMKDPHVGSFAVISCAGYFVLYFGAVSEIVSHPENVWIGAVSGFVLSRILSALAACIFPKARKDGMLRETADAQDGTVTRALVVELAAAVVAAVVFSPISGTAACAVAAAMFLYYRHVSLSVFGGTTGDLAGWFVQVTELATMMAEAVLAALL